MPQSRRHRRSPCKSPPRTQDAKPRREKADDRKPKDSYDLRDIQGHYKALEESKLGVLVHVASQHSVLDVLYGGDTGRPMPSWTHQTTPEIAVSDQQHTGRCWIFATLAVLGHVFRSQYGISNSRAVFSEGYLGFWDLYEKSRLFLYVAYDTRCVPLDDPSLCDLLKNGISDGGDYIFCLNLLDRYGIVPTEYYPNTSYGSMSTEALVTLINQILRDNAITLRTTGDDKLITPMLTNIFSILCMGLGTPPAPWKKMDWQLDQCETMAQYAVEIAPPTHGVMAMPVQQAVAVTNSTTLPPEEIPWKSSVDRTYPIKVPATPKQEDIDDSSISELVSALTAKPPQAKPPQTPPQPQAPRLTPPVAPRPSLPPLMQRTMPLPAPVPPTVPPTPPASPVESTATAMPGFPDEGEYLLPSSATVIMEETAVSPPSSEPRLAGSRPPRRTEDVPSLDGSRRPCVDIGSAGDCKKPGGFSRILHRISPAGCKPQPEEGSGSFFRETMPDTGCLLGRQPAQVCRLAHTVIEEYATTHSEKPREEEAMSFNYTPRDFYYRFLNGVRFIPMVCDPRFPSGTRIISNDANMYGGLPSRYLNVTIDDIEAYTLASLKRNIPVWFACDVKKQLTPEGGRMCNHTDRLAELLPEPHVRGTKLQEIRHFNAVANHALLITAVSIKAGKPSEWRVVNSWGDVGRNSGVFVACGAWFREHVYSINALYDTMTKEHKADVDLRLARPTVNLGPFDPSVI